MIVIDTHVHVYPGQSAMRTLIEGGERLLRLVPEGRQAILILCEAKGQSDFDRMSEQVAESREDGKCANWQPIPNDESVSISMENADDEVISVVKGQQIITKEHLEVLALGQDKRIQHGKSLQDTIECVRASGGHVVLPWGAGKWLGRRGRLIDTAIDSQGDDSGFHLGDNGGRPAAWPVPQFTVAKEMNIKVVRGSDPLPIPRDDARIGTYASGFIGEPHRGSPWKYVSSLLADPESTPGTFGSSMAFWGFVRSQFQLRFNSAKRT